MAEVADRARRFAAAFDAGPVAELLGRLHDVGKALDGFQDYLDRIEGGERDASGPVHAIWGAALAYWVICKCQHDEERWKEICLPIAGHHGGLAGAGALGLRIQEFLEASAGELRGLRRVLSGAGVVPAVQLAGAERRGTRREFFIRLLLSALADADFLATEAHFKPQLPEKREGWAKLGALWHRFSSSQDKLLERAAVNRTPVNSIRAEVYGRCIEAADWPRGFFRLTVPTGGGKTRSGLGFGLRHALRHELRRLVFAVPYTSITDQTAREYRGILGQDAVLEHHSQAADGGDDESRSAERTRARLATENWDAPVIVTTTVQLFESMFANRPGKVRKLHNLVNSVIVLDEAQTLPVEFLETVLDGLKTLVDEYGCSVVFCTATQPAYERIPNSKGWSGFESREIVPEYPQHFEALGSRVHYTMRDAPVSWGELAEEIRDERQVLVVLNSRRDAMALLDALDKTPHVRHLSTLLCGAHRRQVLSDIDRDLDRGAEVRAVCTQVIEAGVDIDFPVAYRAMGPLDRIIQVAGRCNRSGVRTELGRVVIFEPRDGSMPRGTYRAGTAEAALLLKRRGAAALHDPEFCKEYFGRVFSNAKLDARDIQAFRKALDYPETASRFRFIEPTVSAVVRYGESEQRLRDYKRAPSREAWRALQPYVVNLFYRQAEGFERDGLLEPVGKELYRWLGSYDDVRGIVPDALDPSDLIV